MPPPSCANSATKLAPKPKPTMTNGASLTEMSPSSASYRKKMPQTPRSESATTRKPETAPPRIATWTASTRLRRAADAVRTFDRTLMYIPMIPEAIDQVDHDADDDGRGAGEQRDRRVLALDERVRSFADRAGDSLHLGRPGVPRQHVAGEVHGEQHGGDPGDRDQQLERTSHQGVGSSIGKRLGRPPDVWRVSVRRRRRGPGNCRWSRSACTVGWDLS